jgi:hypothetical protein
MMLLQGALTILVSMFRVGTTLAFREYIRWLRGHEIDAGNNREEWYGWMWAALMVLIQTAFVFSQHQQFWMGARLGLCMQQQVRFKAVPHNLIFGGFWFLFDVLIACSCTLDYHCDQQCF